MQKLNFNTGVKIWDNPHIKGGVNSENGTVVIPFECEDVPKNAIFLYACNNGKLEATHSNIIVREIHNSQLHSKYAYFKLI